MIRDICYHHHAICQKQLPFVWITLQILRDAHSKLSQYKTQLDQQQDRSRTAEALKVLQSFSLQTDTYVYIYLAENVTLISPRLCRSNTPRKRLKLLKISKNGACGLKIVLLFSDLFLRLQHLWSYPNNANIVNIQYAIPLVPISNC